VTPAPPTPTTPPVTEGDGTTPSRRHTARWVALTVLVVAAGLVAVLATRPSTTDVPLKAPIVGKQVPVISDTTIDGGTFTLARPPGKWVVVNFFADWCEPCQVEGPELVAFQFEHAKAGDATVLSVVFDDTVPAATAYQRKLGVTWPTVVDRGGRLALDFGVTDPPTTFVVAPDGRVVAAVISPVTAAELDKLIARAKAEGL
jgi:cytochrome c biogenesis protein CcmG, thiol:disulfide interchange protein DsbE